MAVYPDAECRLYCDDEYDEYIVNSCPAKYDELGVGATEAEAWADAASKLPAPPEPEIEMDQKQRAKELLENLGITPREIQVANRMYEAGYEDDETMRVRHLATQIEEAEANLPAPPVQQEPTTCPHGDPSGVLCDACHPYCADMHRDCFDVTWLCQLSRGHSGWHSSEMATGSVTWPPTDGQAGEVREPGPGSAKMKECPMCGVQHSGDRCGRDGSVMSLRLTYGPWLKGATEQQGVKTPPRLYPRYSPEIGEVYEKNAVDAVIKQLRDRIDQLEGK